MIRRTPSRWKWLISLLALVSCASQTAPNRTVVFSKSAMQGSSVLIAAIEAAPDGSVSILESTDFQSIDQFEFSGSVPSRPGILVALLSFAEDLTGQKPNFMTDGIIPSGYRAPAVGQIFYADVAGGSSPTLLTSDDTHSALLNQFAALVAVVIDSAPPLTPTATPTPTATATPPEPVVTVSGTHIDARYNDPLSPSRLHIHDGIIDDCKDAKDPQGISDPDCRFHYTWCSSGDKVIESVQFDFPVAIQISGVEIWWAFNTVQNDYMEAQRIDVKTSPDGTTWSPSPAGQMTWNWDGTTPIPPRNPSSSLTFGAPITLKSLKFEMPRFCPLPSGTLGCGYPTYAYYFWVTEIGYTLIWP
ncbi:MAG: discoidin domain-containing protein [Pseudomonadota bacterium]